MKKILKTLLISGLCFFAITFGIKLTTQNEITQKTYADEGTEFPSYFSSTYSGSGTNVPNLGATFSKNDNEYVSVSLWYNEQFLADNISASIKVDGVSYKFANWSIKSRNDGAIKTWQTFQTQLFIGDQTLNTDGTPPSKSDQISKTYIPEGKVEISFEYLEKYGTNFAENRGKNFTYTFYYYNRTTYFKTSSSNLPNIDMQNVETSNSDSVNFDANYFYNFNNETTTLVDNLYLPNLVYNPKHFNIVVKKTNKGISESATLKFDGTKTNIIRDSSSSDLVKVKTSNTEKNYLSTIVFTDIGEYEISFNFIHYSSVAEVLNVTAGVQKLYVFGYQLFYTDVNSGSLKEFATLTPDLTPNLKTDISYLASKNPGHFTVTDTENGIKISGIPSEVESTNQAPVQFGFNSKLDEGKSFVYTLSSIDEHGTKHYSKTSYTGGTFTEPGEFVINLVYTYPNYIIDGSIAPSQEHSQWFSFKITSETPKAKIIDAQSKIMANASYTNRNVNVSRDIEESVFNSEVILEVSEYNYKASAPITTTTVKPGATITFSNERKYVVTISYGKNSKKKIQTSFFIDKTKIQSLGAYNVSKLTGTTSYKRTSLVSQTFTNQSISVQWNEKDSGAKTNAYYKFIPFQTMNDYSDAEAASQYEAHRWLPVAYNVSAFSNNNTSTLQQIIYGNTLSSPQIKGHEVLNDQGIYVFKVVDAAGNEATESFIIDKSTPRFLVKKNVGAGIAYELSRGELIVSEDITILWGDYKSIKLSSRISSILTQDSEVRKELEKLSAASYIQAYGDKEYLLVPLNPTAYVSKGSTYSPITANEYHIPFLDNSGNALEAQYSILICDFSNTKGENETETQKYLNYASAFQKVTVSSDTSKFNLYYNSGDGENQVEKTIRMHSFNEVGTLYFNKSTNVISEIKGEGFEEFGKSKKMYYLPTKQNILNVSFVPSPGIESGKIIQIEKISLKYYPYVKAVDKHHYVLSTTPVEFDVFKFDPNTNSIVTNLAKQKDLNGSYYYPIYTGYNQNGEVLTQPGKYEITRDYTKASQIDEKDFFRRSFTFFVDRFNVISEPEVVDNNEKLESLSFVGGEIYINLFDGVRKIEGGNEKAINVPVYGLYTNDQSTNPEEIPSTIVNTNKLPVRVYIPSYKYVSKDAKGNVIPIEDLAYYTGKKVVDSEGNILNAINSYKLFASILFQKVGMEGGSVVEYKSTGIDDYGYLTFNKNTFQEAGIYIVTVRQDNDAAVADDNIKTQYKFKFEINNEAPEFQVIDTKGNTINSVKNGTSEIYYTNKQNLTIKFQDPRDNYNAAIEKTDITIYHNGILHLVPASSIVGPGADKSYTITLSLNNLLGKGINAYQDGKELTVKMHYEGEQTFFGSSYSKEKVIRIDLKAPTNNINSVLDANKTATGIDKNQLRDSFKENGTQGDNYNVSKTIGNYRYYSFAVNRNYILNTLFNVISTNANETNKIYLRSFVRFDNDGTTPISTKYDSNYLQETNYNNFNSEDFIELSSDNYNDILNNETGKETNLNYLRYGHYYEVVEQDIAGNLTIYTLYINNAENKNILSYKDSLNQNKQVEESDVIGGSLDVYAKGTFSLNTINNYADPWYNLSFTVGLTEFNYLHTPYLASNQVINLTTQNTVTLENIYNFVAKNTKYNLVLSNRRLNTKTNILISISDQRLSIRQDDPNVKTEYIDIETPIEESISGPTTIIFPKSITIYREIVDAGYQPVYANKNATGRFGQYLPNTEVSVESTIQSDKRYVRLKFKTVPNNNTKFRYEIVDNYGNVYNLVHYFNEPIISENERITGENSIYTRSIDGNIYNISTGRMYYKYNSAKHTVKLFDEQTGVQVPSNITGTGDIKTIQIGEIRQNQNSKYTLYIYEPNSLETALDKAYFQVYNILPGITNTLPSLALTDKNNTNITEKLFSKDGVYSGPITIRFTSPETYEYPYKIELNFNNTGFVTAANQSVIEKPGNYRLRISYDVELIKLKYNLDKNILQDTVITYDFELSDTLVEFFYVAYDNDMTGNFERINSTGKPFSYENGTKTIGTHYIVNTLDTNLVKIVRNELQDVALTNTIGPIKNGMVETYIYTISNKNSEKPNISWFSKDIAISYVPAGTKVATTFNYFKADGTTENFDALSKTVIATTEEENFKSIRITFNSYNQLPENKITVTILKDGALYSPKVFTMIGQEGTSYFDLNKSGVYQIKMKDYAGNVHEFKYQSTISKTSDTYELTFLKDVIFTINNESPIPNAVYNSKVSVQIPISTLALYNTSSRPIIHTLKDGKEYTGFTTTNTYSHTFKEPGLYEVWFSAKSGINDKEIRQERYAFTILEPLESRLAYEFSEYGDYYISNIIKGTEDVTSEMTEKLNFNKVTIGNKTYLKQLLISNYDEKTGPGKYTITVQTNNELNQKFTFSFWINAQSPPIIVSVPEGTNTTDKITVSYNPKNIHASVGDCYVLIGSNKVLITSETLLTLAPLITYEITVTGTYYVQIYTLSDNLLYSYKIIKSEPLNVISIIIIIVAVIAVIAIAIVFILLRKRIRVK